MSFTFRKIEFSTDVPVESVEKQEVFNLLRRKTVENSVENVEKGSVIRLILEHGSGKNRLYFYKDSITPVYTTLHVG